MQSNYNKANLYQQAYLRAEKTLMESGMTVNDPKQANTIRMAQSALRSEIFANLGQSEFQFPILTNDPSPGSPVPTPTSTEIRLKQQDVFFVCELGFYIYCARTNGGNTSWRYVDMTFPDPNLIGGAWTPGFGLNLAQALWTTGRLNVQVNNVAVTPLWPIKNHSFVPQNQILGNAIYPTADPSAGGFATGMEVSFNPVSYDSDGRAMIWPNWLLNGGNNNQYTLTYPNPINALGIAANAQLWFVLEFHGFLAQNASSIMSMKK